MKQYPPEKIRNVAVVGHGSCGKTSLVEALLFTAKATTRLGAIENGTTVTDFEPEEVKRKISLSTALAPCEWEGCKINLLDTPGYADFIGEAIGAVHAADNVLFVIDGVRGSEVQTEKLAKVVNDLGLPKICVVNGLDRENADFDQAVESIKNKVFSTATPIMLPIGKEHDFKGVIDLVTMKAYVGNGNQAKIEAIPDDMRAQADKYREKMIELIVEVDDTLLEKFLEEGDIKDEDLQKTMALSIAKGHLIPILCSSGTHEIGTIPILNTIAKNLPSPADMPDTKGTDPKIKEETTRKHSTTEPMCALVFKTISDPYVGKLDFIRVFSGIMKADATAYNATKAKRERVGHILSIKGKSQEDVKEIVAGDIAAAPKLEGTFTGDTLCDESKPIILPTIEFPAPVYSLAIEPKTRGDEEKMGTSLNKLAEEDPTFGVKRDAEMRQTVISGLGDLQLEIVADRLKRKFGVETVLDVPKVPYRETILKGAKGQGKYKKQTGGRGQYGDVWLEIAPLKRGDGFEFEDKIFGGSIPRNYVPAVEKGVRESMVDGVVAGFPLIDFKVTVYDGSFHPVDSSDMAFKIAASMAFKKVAGDAQPIILEPVMNVEIQVPEAYMGDVIGDLNSKRGRILGMDSEGNSQLVKAHVPLSEMGRYASELRSITHGQGSYKMEFFSYEHVPPQVTEKIIKEHQSEKESKEH
ncbi:MAG: elongation factor G [Bacteroidetes bacterium]|nr:elongation factor G [Bacteroidota bacterium]